MMLMLSDSGENVGKCCVRRGAGPRSVMAASMRAGDHEEGPAPRLQLLGLDSRLE